MLIQPSKSCLLIVDAQERLIPVVKSSQQIIENIGWLAGIAKELGIPTFATEQYPAGLGSMESSIASFVESNNIMSKRSFSCMNDPTCNEKINKARPSQIVLVGMEAHISVLQTAIQLKQQAREVYVVEDCVGSRNALDQELALQRLRQCGVYVVTREMVAFEWLQTSTHPKFRQISSDFLR